MLERISCLQKKVQRPQDHLSKNRSPNLKKKKIAYKFLKQLDDGEFDVILVRPKNFSARERPEENQPDSPQFVFQPMATSTPSKQKNRIEHSRINDEPDFTTEEHYTLRQRLTMSQFIGTLPKKHCEKNDFAVGSRADGVAVNLRNSLHKSNNDFDFAKNDIEVSAVDLNKTQNHFSIIYEKNSADLMENLEAQFSINEPTCFIFNPIFGDENSQQRRHSFMQPKSCEGLKIKPQLDKLSNIGKYSYLLSAESKQLSLKKIILKGMQFELKELKELYEILKILFAEAEFT